MPKHSSSFLEKVAMHIQATYGSDLSNIAIVVPNKRTSLFLNNFLTDSDRPIWRPQYFTISDLFEQQSTRVIADPIKLICDLHQSFTSVMKSSETLDHFYGWGQVLLSDFDDIDKNMADTRQLFGNLQGLHDFDDNSFLTDIQREALTKFFRHVDDEHDTPLKDRFKELWNKLADIYDDFNRRLGSQNLCYEGALYRDVASKEDLYFPCDRYLLVGFNMLQKVEQKLFMYLQREGKAAFYWNFDAYYMGGSEQHEAGMFIRQYLDKFPNELPYTDEVYHAFENPKDIYLTAASTDTAQAKFVGAWLQEHNRFAGQTETAIVLCDENLLAPVIHSIPGSVPAVNITTGYPLQQAPVSGLVHVLIALRTLGYESKRQIFRRKYILNVLQHPYAHLLFKDGETMPDNVDDMLPRSYYISLSDVMQSPMMQCLLSDLETAAYPDEPYNHRLLLWLMDELALIGKNAGEEGEPFLQESVFRMYTLLNRLRELVKTGDLLITTDTLQRIIRQIIASTSIPFHGEPIQGIQVMGVLETRNLDFTHLLILSCNEGNMPKGVNDTSFIPHSLRRAFELTTVENKVAIYAYYFHQLLQRADDITVVYSNAMQNGKMGEMSRFMLQLMVESGHTIHRQTLQTGQGSVVGPLKRIEKIPMVMDILNSLQSLSPTAINRYRRCNLQFYYYHVLGIKELNDTEDEEIDNRAFGNIFHRVAELVYNELGGPGTRITHEAVEHLLTDEHIISRLVDTAFAEEVFNMPVEKAVQAYNGLHLVNKEVITAFATRLLNIDKQLTPFTFVNAETPAFEEFTIGGRTLKIGGIIDRLDRLSKDGGRIRVIDYKTGQEARTKIKDMDELFVSEKMQERHADYYFQTMLYSLIVSKSTAFNPERLPVSPALLFIQNVSDEETYNPTIKIGSEYVNDVEPYRDEFMKRLSQLVDDIFNPELPFLPPKTDKVCGSCPYAKLCNRK